MRLFTEPDEFIKRAGDAFSDLLHDAVPWLVLFSTLAVVTLVAIAPLRRLPTARLSADARRVRILPPPDVAAEGALTLWMGLHAILRPASRRMVSGQPHLSWGVVAKADAIEIYLWVPRVVPPGLIERAVATAWPGARTEPATEVEILPHVDVATTELALAEPEWFPIGEAPDTEPLRLALGTMTALDAGERAVIQVLARPATSAARYRLLRAARRLRKTAPSLPFWAAAQAPATNRVVRMPLDPTIEPDVRAVLQKAASPLWRRGVRVAVSSLSRPRARGKIHALAGAFAVFEGRNGFRRRRALGGAARLEGRVLCRGYLLSVPELA